MSKSNLTEQFLDQLEEIVNDQYEDMTILGFKYLPEDMSESKDGKIIKHSQTTDIIGGDGVWEVNHLLNQPYATKRDRENNLNPHKKGYLAKIKNDTTKDILRKVGDVVLK